MRSQPYLLSWRGCLADYLCRLACWLRGEKWYVSKTWHGVPGNRVSELKQTIWEQVVVMDVNGRLMAYTRPGEDGDALDIIEAALTELGQMAGESWGHILPKDAIPVVPDFRSNKYHAKKA